MKRSLRRRSVSKAVWAMTFMIKFGFVVSDESVRKPVSLSSEVLNAPFNLTLSRAAFGAIYSEFFTCKHCFNFELRG